MTPLGRSVAQTPDAEFGLHLYGGRETTAQSHTGRRVMLRRPLQGGFPPSPTPLSQPTGKPVLLAHRIRPGETIQLKSSPNKGSLAEGSPLVTQPESVAMSGTQGPRYAASGCVPYSLLGTPQEYESMLNATKGYEGMPPSPQWGDNDSHGGGAGGSSQRGGSAMFEQLDRREAQQRSKLSRSASQAQRRMFQAQQSALKRYDQANATWERQSMHLSGRLGVNPRKLLMGAEAIDDYRQKVEELELLAAAKASLGGERSWEVGLRGGGIYYVPIGTGGLYMPIQVRPHHLPPLTPLHSPPYSPAPHTLHTPIPSQPPHLPIPLSRFLALPSVQHHHPSLYSSPPFPPSSAPPQSLFTPFTHTHTHTHILTPRQEPRPPPRNFARVRARPKDSPSSALTSSASAMQIQMQPSGRGNLKPLPHSASAPELASRGSDGRLISKSQGKADNKPSRWLGPSSPPNPRAKGGALARARAEAASEQAQSQLQGYADDSSYRGSSAGELQDVTGELQLTRQERRSSAASPPLSPKLLSQTSLIDKKKEAHRELEGLKVAAPSYTPSHPVRPLTPHSPPFTPSHRSHTLAHPRTPSHRLAPPCTPRTPLSNPFTGERPFRIPHHPRPRQSIARGAAAPQPIAAAHRSRGERLQLHAHRRVRRGGRR